MKSDAFDDVPKPFGVRPPCGPFTAQVETTLDIRPTKSQLAVYD